MGPGLTLEGDFGRQSEAADADDPFLLRDNEYSHPRTTSDDDEDDDEDDEDDQCIGTPPSSLALTRGRRPAFILKTYSTVFT